MRIARDVPQTSINQLATYW